MQRVRSFRRCVRAGVLFLQVALLRKLWLLCIFQMGCCCAVARDCGRASICFRFSYLLSLQIGSSSMASVLFAGVHMGGVLHLQFVQMLRFLHREAPAV